MSERSSCREEVSLDRLSLRFFFWLCLDLGSLEGDDLRLELVIVLFQHLLLLDGVIVVKNRLLHVIICFGLLLPHLLLHIAEHMEDLAFV